MPRIRTHPGEYLSEEYLKPLKLSAADLAEAIGVPPARIAEIVRGQQGVSADTALRLGRYFRTTPHFWITLQAGYDLSKAAAEIDLTSIEPRSLEAAET